MEATFASAMNAEYEKFSKEDYSSALASEPAVAVYGFTDKGRMIGQLYQTKEKVLVAVFLGILSREPPAFGRIFVGSSGEPNSTIKLETVERHEMAAKGFRGLIDKCGVRDGSDYHETFLKTMAGELGFSKGFLVPGLNGMSFFAAPEGINTPWISELAREGGGARDPTSEEPEPEPKSGKRKSPPPADPEPEDECMICMDAKPQTLVLPCLHKVVCEGCSVALMESRDKRTCVYCRRPITGISHESGEAEVFSD